MRTWVPCLLVVAVVLVFAAPSVVRAQTPTAKPATDKPGADKPSPDKPSAQKPGVVVVAATVEAVDKDKRTVTRQVKVGDDLVIRHTEAVALAVTK